METVSFTSPDYIKINGVSSETIGLYVDTPPVPPMSKQRVTRYKGGIDFDVSTRDDVWDDITLTFNAYVFFSSNDFDLSSVYAFFANAETLEISRFPGFYFKVRSVNGIAPKRQYQGDKIGVTVSIVCKPFKYLTSNDWTVPVEGKIINPGTRFCRPVYRIQGAQTTTLTVNTSTFTVTDAGGTDFYIDSERMLCYLENGTNIMPKTAGNLPFMQPGINNISVSAGTVAVKLNGRCY